MRFTISICLIAAFGLVSAGCVDSRPIHYYSLQTPSIPATRVATDGPVLLVGNISVPEAMQDGRIHYRAGANEVGAYDYHRWIEQPGMMVSSSLARALRASGKYRSVLHSSSAVSGDYLLRGQLYEFGEVDRETIQTRISLQVELVDQKTKRSVWDHIVNRDEPVTSKQIKDVVESFDRNLQAVVNETVTEIDKFLAGSR
jgi:ABC-type uncharacterized transport system auxiliary subunit